jgi:hypothetical protein
MKETSPFSEGSYLAPENLLEPTRRVVNEAMSKVLGSDKATPLIKDDTIIVALKNNKTDDFYRITIIDVIQVHGRSEELLLRGDTEVGLFIATISKEEAGKRKLSNVQFPREPEKVNRGSIYNLRDISPESMNDLAEGLSATEIIPLEKYQAEADKIRKRYW